MQVHTVQPNPWIQYSITAVVIGIVLFFRLRRMNKERPLKLERLWILPACYGVFLGVMYTLFPPTGLVWLYCVLALAIGAAAGWWRGRMMRISVDPVTHALNHRQSPAAILFIVVLIAVRAGAREMTAVSQASLHISTMAITDVLIAFALGLLTLQRVEMYLRATRMLGDVRAAKA